MGDIQTALNSKNPQVKEGTLKFLARCLSTTLTPIISAQVKPLAEQLAGLMEDQLEGARNEAALCLGTLMKMVGERPLSAVMESLADVRRVKVKEAFEKATIKAKAGSGPPKPAPGKTVPSSKSTAPKPVSKLSAAPIHEPSPGPPNSDNPSEEMPSEDTRPTRKPPARLTVRLPYYMLFCIRLIGVGEKTCCC
jgi:cytoskeleton-associated protein 5